MVSGKPVLALPRAVLSASYPRFIYYTLERVAACPQVDTGHLPDVAEKLVEIAQSPLFPRVDYELQLRWRNGQTGIDAGYATVARIDKNAILAMGRLLGGKK